MKLLKILVTLTLSTLATQAFAESEPVKRLSCGGKNKTFSVVLDPGTWEEGSGFIMPLNARLRDNFFTSHPMTCIGHRPEELRCVGYANGKPTIVEVVISLDLNNVLWATYEKDLGRGPVTTQLPCLVETN